MTHRVLIVDDNPGECRRIVDMAAGLGYQAEAAAGGAVAFDRLAEGTVFDAILLDMVMPELDGMGVLERLPRLLVPAPPVVAVVTERGADLARSAARAGARDYLTKPVDHDRLHFVLKNTIRLAELERAVGRHRSSIAVAADGRMPVEPPIRRPGGATVAERRQQRGNAHGDAPDADDSTALRHYDAVRLLQGSDVRNLKALEHDIIRFSLDHYQWRLSEVARRLGIGRSTLYRKLKEHRIAINGAV